MVRSENTGSARGQRRERRGPALTSAPAGHAGIVLILTALAGAAAQAQTLTTSDATVADNSPAGPDQGTPSSKPKTVVPLSAAGAAVPGAAPNTAFAPPATPVATTGASQSDPYANYRWKGIIINLPPPSNTIDGDLFGYRQKLADDYGIGWIGGSITTFYDNVLRHDHHAAQSYNGQKPTVLSTNFLTATIDLSRYGIPDGQIAVTGEYQSTSWNAGGPTTLSLGQLSYYQTLFDKRVELKIGLLSSNFAYLGSYAGGSLNGGVFGPSGSLSIETGTTTTATATYGFNITGHITKYVYDQFGVARSGNPGGLVLEHNYNPTATRFSTPNTGAWVINEFGYLRPAARDTPQTWVRLGSSYSAAHYVELDHSSRASPGNYFVYLLGDRQILQVSSKPREAYRGLYVGASAEYVPPNLNRFSQYYEARIFGLGLLPHRPVDQVSLVLTDTVFSDFLYGEAIAAHHPAHTDSKAITGSYSFNVVRGVYLSAGLAYVNHPTAVTYTSSTGSALNAITSLAIFF